MTTRRKFFQVLGLGAGVTATGVVGAAAVLPDPAKQKAIKDIQDAQNPTLLFRATFGERAPTPKNQELQALTIGPNFPSNYIKGTEKQVEAKMTIGSDGNLYLTQNGKWVKIVTE